MVLLISKELSDYIKGKHGLDLNQDKNICSKDYNPSLCLARVWKSNSDYLSNSGGYSNFQCQYIPKNGNEFCECHSNRELTFGRIDQEKPKEPCIIDNQGNKIRYYWIEDSVENHVDYVDQDQETQNSGEKRGRGRPPSKRILFNTIDWNELFTENKLDTLPLPTIKEYLIKEKLSPYGKKENLIERIKENIMKSQ